MALEEVEATNDIDESYEDNLQEEVEGNNDIGIFFISCVFVFYVVVSILKFTVIFHVCLFFMWLFLVILLFFFKKL